MSEEGAPIDLFGPDRDEPVIEKKRGPVWDLPLRLFHWTLALLILGAWYTVENDMLDWHLYIGMTILILLIFRLIWGFVGGSTARFSQFFASPSRIMSYLKDSKNWRGIGHNPLASLSVWALLGLTAFQVGLGLFATDNDGLMEGPLAGKVSLDTTEAITDLHETMFNVLLAFIALHIVAIIFYMVRGKNLVGPMVTGEGEVPEGAAPLVKARWWVGLVALVAAWAIAGVIFSAGGAGG